MERFVRWAETRPDIRAAVVVGSRARVDHPADEWADLDVVVITTDPKRYLATTSWVESIGNPLLTFFEPTATGDEMERRVLFEGMLDVDFSIIPEQKARQLLTGKLPSQVVAQISDTFNRGMRLLLDKDGMVAQLQRFIGSIKAPVLGPPSQHEFSEVVNDFLYHAIFTAKHLRRGELWWAKTCCDCYMQRLLLRMIEWHARTTHGWNYDTWFRGRFLEKWADPRVVEGLRRTFAHYDEADVGRGLMATMDLFRKISMEVAEKLRYAYPIAPDKLVRKWIKTSLSGRD